MQQYRMQSEQLEAVRRFYRTVRNLRRGLASSQDVDITVTHPDTNSRASAAPGSITAAATSRSSTSLVLLGPGEHMHQGPVQQLQSSAPANSAQVLSRRPSRQVEWVPVTTVVDERPSTALSRLAASRRSSRGTQTAAPRGITNSTASGHRVSSSGSSGDSATASPYAGAATASAAGRQHIPRSSVQSSTTPANSRPQHMYTTAPAQSLQQLDVQLGQYIPSLRVEGASGGLQQHSMGSSNRRAPSAATERPAGAIAPAVDAAPASHASRPAGTSTLSGLTRPVQALAAARALDAMYTQQLAAQRNIHSTSRALALPFLPQPQHTALGSSRLSTRPSLLAAAVPTGAAASSGHRAVSFSEESRRGSTAALPASGAASWLDGSLLPRPPSTQTGSAEAAAATVTAAGAAQQLQQPRTQQAAQLSALAESTASAAGPAAVRVSGGYRLLTPPHAATLTQTSRYNTGATSGSSMHSTAASAAAPASRSLVDIRASSCTTRSNRPTLGPSRTEQSTASYLALNPDVVSAGLQLGSRASLDGPTSGRSPLRLHWPAHPDYGITASPFAAASGAAAATIDSAATQLPHLSAATAAAATAAPARSGSNRGPSSAGQPMQAALQALPGIPPATLSAQDAAASGTAALQHNDDASDNTTTAVDASHTSHGMSRDSSVMSLSELLGALRDGYSLLPTSPTLTDIIRPSSTSPADSSITPADSSAVVQLGGVAAQPSSISEVPTLLEVQASTTPAADSAAGAAAAAMFPAGLQERGGVPSLTARSGPAAEPLAAPSSSSSSSSSSSDQEVLMAVQLLTDSLRMLRETHSLIDSMLALGVPDVTGPAPHHGVHYQQAAGNMDRQGATAASGASDTSNSTSRISQAASSITSTPGHADISSNTTTTTSGSSSDTDDTIVQSRPDQSSSSSTSSYVAGNLFTCVVCMDRPRSVLLLPCKHLVLCGSCFDRMSADARSRHQDRSTATVTTGPFLLDQDDETLMQRLLHHEHVLSAPATFGGNDAARAGMHGDPPAGGGSAGPATTGSGSEVHVDAAAAAPRMMPSGSAARAAAGAESAAAGAGSAAADAAAETETGPGSGSDAGAVPRRRSSNRQWLGPIPPGVVLPPGGTGLIDFHWWARPVQPDRQGGGLRAAGPGMEAARLARHDVLLYGALVRCPLCRTAVEQSVSGVLIV